MVAAVSKDMHQGSRVAGFVTAVHTGKFVPMELSAYPLEMKMIIANPASRLILFALAILSVGLFSASPAHAQCNPGGEAMCQAMEDMQRVNDQNMAQQRQEMLYMQQQQNSYAPAPAQQGPFITGWMAIVAHPDVPEIWETQGYSSQNVGIQRALDACAQKMGEGCYLVGTSTWHNRATLIVVRDRIGDIYVAGGDSLRPDKIENAVMKQCMAASDSCRPVAEFRNSVDAADNFPSSVSPRRVFGVVVRPKGAPAEKWHYTAWLASGMRGYKAAQEAALTNCRADTGMDCEPRITTGGGLIARAVQDNGYIVWQAVTPGDRVDQQVAAQCQKGHQCRLVDTFDVQRPKTWRIDDYNASDHPERGFFALARPVDDNAERSWGKRALATGRVSRAEAQAAAVALCESESKTSCMATPKAGDQGTEQFLILARDASGMSHSSFGSSAAFVQQGLKTTCTTAAVKCGKGVVLDLAMPVTTIVAY